MSRLVFSPDGRTLAASAIERVVVLWEVATRRVRGRLRSRSLLFPQLAFAPDGKSLVNASDYTLELWHLDTGNVRALMERDEISNFRAAFSPDGKFLAVGDEFGAVTLLGLPDGKKRAAWRGKGSIYSLAFSPAGSILVTGGGKPTVPAFGRVRLWDVAAGRLRATLWRTELPIWCLAFAPDNKVLAAADGGNIVRLWDFAAAKCLATWDAGIGVNGMTFSPDGRILITAGGRNVLPKDRGVVQFWDLATRREVRRIVDPEDEIYSLALSPDGRLLAVCAGTGTVNLWDVSGLTRERRPAAPSPQRVPVRRLPGRPVGPKPEERKALEQWWADLAANDPERAYRAMWGFVRTAGPAGIFLGSRLQPATPADPGLVDRLISGLDSKTFRSRKRAELELAGLGALAQPALRRALARKPSSETRLRISRLLRKLESDPPTGEILRTLRALEALEYIGSPAAQRVLQRVAGGRPRPA